MLEVYGSFNDELLVFGERCEVRGRCGEEKRGSCGEGNEG